MKKLIGDYYGDVSEFYGRFAWNVTNVQTGRGRGALCEDRDEAHDQMRSFAEEDSVASFFVVIEGAEGVGKSTLVRSLTESLRTHMLLTTSEPNVNCVGHDFIRRYLSGEMEATAHTMRLAYALNRADHNAAYLKPFMGQGSSLVLCDRYILSSLVYQSEIEADLDTILEINRQALIPNLTLLLDASPDTLIERLINRNGQREIFDDKVAELSMRYAECADWLVNHGHRILVIPADQPADRVHRSALYEIGRYAPLWVSIP